jgi:hypothetical protein
MLAPDRRGMARFAGFAVLCGSQGAGSDVPERSGLTRVPDGFGKPPETRIRAGEVTGRRQLRFCFGMELSAAHLSAAA